MSTVKIRAALEKRLAAMVPNLPTQYENGVDLSAADKAGAHQAVYLLLAEPENPTQGHGFHRENGFMQITLSYSLAEGTGDAAARAEAIRAWFLASPNLVEGDVTVTIHRTPQIMNGFRDKDRWCVPVRVFFFSNVYEGA